MRAPQPKTLAKQVDREFTAKTGTAAAERTVRPSATHLDREAAYPIRKEPEAIDHEVHHHCVVGILRATQSGLHNGETRLHKHDQKARDQRPDEVDRNSILTRLIDDVCQRETLFGIGCYNITDSSGFRASRIAFSHVVRRWRCCRFDI